MPGLNEYTLCSFGAHFSDHFHASHQKLHFRPLSLIEGTNRYILLTFLFSRRPKEVLADLRSSTLDSSSTSKKALCEEKISAPLSFLASQNQNEVRVFALYVFT